MPAVRISAYCGCENRQQGDRITSGKLRITSLFMIGQCGRQRNRQKTTPKALEAETQLTDAGVAEWQTLRT